MHVFSYFKDSQYVLENKDYDNSWDKVAYFYLEFSMYAMIIMFRTIMALLTTDQMQLVFQGTHFGEILPLSNLFCFVLFFQCNPSSLDLYRFFFQVHALILSSVSLIKLRR